MSTFVVATSLLLSVVACGSPSQTTESQLKVESTAVSSATETSTSAKSGPVTLADTAVQTPLKIQLRRPRQLTPFNHSPASYILSLPVRVQANGLPTAR